MTRSGMMLFAVLSAGLAFARDAPPPPQQVADIAAYPATPVVFPNGVSGVPAIPFLILDGFRPLTLDLYQPMSRAKAAPLVVFIHGGGWVGGDSRRIGPFFLGALAALAARGYVVAAVNYRLSGEARFPAQLEDVQAGIRFLREHAGDYGIDPSRVVAWGVSAGGHLAALAGVSCHASHPSERATTGAAEPAAGAAASDCVQGAVAWYAPFDMATIADQARAAGALSRDAAGAPEWLLLGCAGARCRPDQIRLASPAALVARNTPPMLLIAGDADTTVPYRQTTEMAARLEAAGIVHEVMIMPGLNHSLVGTTPQATREANGIALAATFRFINRTVGEQEP